ncbi:MAG: hypothetical protein KGJ73_13040, partial [Rhodospirillales bacterium]|nr:hypothetical protein [Rhodospirillales bacterium]
MQEEEDDDFLYRPHRSKGQRLDPAIQRMAIAAAGISVLVILVAWIWSGIHPYTFGPPPVISPPDIPLRVVPADPGGMVVPEANVPIMSGEMRDDGTPHLASAGPAPDIAALDQAAGLTPPGASTQAPAPPAQQSVASASAVPVPATDEPQSVTPAASQAPRPGSTATSAAAAENMTSVQLAATSSEDGVLGIWVKLRQKFPDLMKGRQPEIIPVIL